MALEIPYPYPDPITGEWEPFAMIRNFQFLRQNIYGTNSPTPVNAGGTGLTSYTIGDLLYASAAAVLSKLGIGTAGQVLTVSGGLLPVWSSAPAASAEGAYPAALLLMGA